MASPACENDGVTVLLVRHARAGRRDRWKGDDRLRPLSKKGRQQVEALVPVLLDFVDDDAVVMSSPWLRCRQTIEPLAAALGVEMEESEALAEGMGRKALDLVSDLAGQTAVLCTHGDIVEEVLDHLRLVGVDLGRKPVFPKASTWVLRERHGEFREARYLLPPA
jgi:8-oxo-dGTP diphosphatase